MKEFTIHVAETSHYEFKVSAKTRNEALTKGQAIWRAAATVGQWQLSDEETDYRVTEGGSHG